MAKEGFHAASVPALISGAAGRQGWSLCLGAGVAGIYGVATKPEARGLGLARILTLQALREARLGGYDRGVLHSTPMARSLYEKIGFRTYSRFRIFAPPQTFHL